MSWEISIPDMWEPGRYEPRGKTLDSYKEALEVAQRVWGADENGNINIVNEIHEEEDDFDDDLEAV